MFLTRFAVNSPVKVTMIFVGMLLLGWISLARLPTSLFPDIRAPRVTTTVRTVGLSPQEVERLICEPLERQLHTLRGVTSVTSIARADSAVVVTEFTWDTPLDFAFLDVKKAASDLQGRRSQEIDSVSVLRYDPNAAPVVVAGLTPGPSSNLEDLRRLAEQTLKPRFERLEGVANVVVAGGEEPEVRIALNEALLIRYGIDASAVVSALQAENVNATGGYVTEGTQRYLLKSIGELSSPEDVERVVVARQAGAPVLLRDVGEVSLSPRDPRDAVLVDGEEAVGLLFYREAEGNTVAVAQRIREEMTALGGLADEQRPRRGAERESESAAGSLVLPPGAKFVIASDQSEFIQAAIREVRSNAILGGLLAVLVLLAFLRDVRTTLIIAVAIPVSVVATFNLMYFQGLSLNVMTLGGLALGCGMLVDSAIVVLENIHRQRQEGRNPFEAASLGTSQVAGAITAATLTTIVVFLPVVYVRGVAGLLFKEQALTVVYSLLAALVMALLLIPMLASRFLAPGASSLSESKGDGDVPRGVYPTLLRGALRVRTLVLLVAGGVLALSVWALDAIPREFLPRTEQRQVGVRSVLPAGTPLDTTRRVSETLVDSLADYREAIPVAFVRVGESEGEIDADTRDPDGPNTADLFFRLHNWDRPTTAALEADLGGFRASSLVRALEPRLEQVPDAQFTFRMQQGTLLDLVGGGGAPLVLEISGESAETLAALAEEAASRLAGVPGLINVRTNVLEGAPEVHLALDRAQLRTLGLDVQGVANQIGSRLEGRGAGTIRRDGTDLDLRVEIDYGEESLRTLRSMILTTPTGARVPLGNIAELRIERGPRELVRRHQSRVAQIFADFEEGVKLSDAVPAATGALEGMHRPVGYSWQFTGEERERAEAFGRLGFALLLSIALVYMVMASIFESFLQPLLIMLTVPLAAAGVVGLFLLTGQTLNVMALIGIVMLGGIVVNNAIVLLDCVNQVRAARPDLDARASLVVGCNRRLRPVLMTTLTTLLALLPLAAGFGPGAELRQSLALAVVGGLISSTLLTLFVIPVAQSGLDSAIARLRSLTARGEIDAGSRELETTGGS